MRRNGSHLRLLGPALAAIAGLTACSGQGEASANPYQAEVAAAAQAATTDFERDILADGAITDEEWSEASSRYIECVQDLGLAATEYPDHSGYEYHYTSDPQSADTFDWDQLHRDIDGADSTCRVGTIGVLSKLYQEMKSNPEKRDFWDDLVPECLMRTGVTKDRMTGEQIKQEMADGGQWQVPTGDVNGCLLDPYHYKASDGVGNQ